MWKRRNHGCQSEFKEKVSALYSEIKADTEAILKGWDTKASEKKKSIIAKIKPQLCRKKKMTKLQEKQTSETT